MSAVQVTLDTPVTSASLVSLGLPVETLGQAYKRLAKDLGKGFMRDWTDATYSEHVYRGERNIEAGAGLTIGQVYALYVHAVLRDIFDEWVNSAEGTYDDFRRADRRRAGRLAALARSTGRSWA